MAILERQLSTISVIICFHKDTENVIYLLLILKSVYHRSMKWRVVILTFISYALMHALITGYSFSKTYFKEEYQFSNVLLAVLDSVIYLSLGLGFLLRYCFLNRHNIVLTYFVATLVFSTAFILFPILSILNFLTPQNAGAIAVILMFLFGFFQMHHWPISLILVTDYCNNEKDGTLIAFWSSNGPVGNMIGYFFPSLLIINAHLQWQIPLIIVSLVLIFFTSLVYFVVERKSSKKTRQYEQIQSNESEQISCSDLLNGFKQFLSSLDNTLLLISACVYKAITYTFLLWLPIYVSSKGEANSSALVSIIFNISNVIGSTVIGKLYESDGKNQCYIYLQYIWVIMGLMAILGTVFLMLMTTFSPFAFTLIVFLEGFITGSIIDVIAGNEMIKLAEGNQKRLDINTTIIYSIPTLTIGVTQLIIGLYMAVQTNRDDEFKSIFTVMLGLSIIGFIALSLRSWKIIHKIAESQS